MKKSKENNTKNEEMLVTSNENNKIEILPDVIAAIVTEELKQIKEVEKASSFLDTFGNKNSKGIKVEIKQDKKVKVDINILVEYGARIPDVAFIIQTNVKKSVENMTALVVEEVNIHVQGIKNLEEEVK